MCNRCFSIGVSSWDSVKKSCILLKLNTKQKQISDRIFEILYDWNIIIADNNEIHDANICSRRISVFGSTGYACEGYLLETHGKCHLSDYSLMRRQVCSETAQFQKERERSFFHEGIYDNISYTTSFFLIQMEDRLITLQKNNKHRFSKHTCTGCDFVFLYFISII